MSIFLKMKKIMGCHVIEVLTRMTGHAHRTGISALSLGINKLLLKKTASYTSVAAAAAHLIHKVGLHQVLLLVVVRSLDGDKEDVDAGLSGQSRRLLHLVRGPSVHQHHGHVGRSPAVPVGVTEVLLVDVGEGLPCQDTRGQQRGLTLSSVACFRDYNQSCSLSA